MEPQLNGRKSDTTPEALNVQYATYRRMSAAQKLRLVFDAYHTGRQLAMAGLRMRHPDAAEDELWRLWARQHLGRELFEAAYGAPIRE